MTSRNVDDEPDDGEPWQILRLWAVRHPHVVCWLLVGVTFAVELFVTVEVEESGTPFAAVLTLPLAFLPLVFLWLAIDRTKRVMELHRLVVGKWRADGAGGALRIEFTPNGTMLLNDALVTDFALFANYDLVVSSDQVRAVLGDRVVSLGEDELVPLLDGSVCRFTRVG